MLDGVVAALFAERLGRFIKGIDKDSMNVSLIRGVIEVGQVELTRDALVHLGIPMLVVRGVIGSLRIDVPWTSLATKSCEVLIEDVCLLVAPHTAIPFDEEAQRKREKELRKVELEQLDAARGAELDRRVQFLEKLGASGDAGVSFADRMKQTIFNNLKITVRRIAMRMEVPSWCPGPDVAVPPDAAPRPHGSPGKNLNHDSASTFGCPLQTESFVVAVRIDEVNLVACDSSFKPTFVGQQQKGKQQPASAAAQQAAPGGVEFSFKLLHGSNAEVALCSATEEDLLMTTFAPPKGAPRGSKSERYIEWIDKALFLQLLHMSLAPLFDGSDSKILPKCNVSVHLQFLPLLVDPETANAPKLQLTVITDDDLVSIRLTQQQYLYIQRLNHYFKFSSMLETGRPTRPLVRPLRKFDFTALRASAGTGGSASRNPPPQPPSNASSNPYAVHSTAAANDSDSVSSAYPSPAREFSVGRGGAGSPSPSARSAGGGGASPGGDFTGIGAGNCSPSGLMSEHPAKKWWRHAYAVVLESVRERRARTNFEWTSYLQWRTRRRRYRDLFYRTLKGSIGTSLEQHEEEEKSTLEFTMPLSDLAWSREQAFIMIDRRDAKMKKFVDGTYGEGSMGAPFFAPPGLASSGMGTPAGSSSALGVEHTRRASQHYQQLGQFGAGAVGAAPGQHGGQFDPVQNPHHAHHAHQHARQGSAPRHHRRESTLGESPRASAAALGAAAVHTRIGCRFKGLAIAIIADAKDTGMLELFTPMGRSNNNSFASRPSPERSGAGFAQRLDDDSTTPLGRSSGAGSGIGGSSGPSMGGLGDKRHLDPLFEATLENVFYTCDVCPAGVKMITKVGGIQHTRHDGGRAMFKFTTLSREPSTEGPREVRCPALRIDVTMPLEGTTETNTTVAPVNFALDPSYLKRVKRFFMFSAWSGSSASLAEAVANTPLLHGTALLDPVAARKAVQAVAAATGGWDWTSTFDLPDVSLDALDVRICLRNCKAKLNALHLADPVAGDLDDVAAVKHEFSIAGIEFLRRQTGEQLLAIAETSGSARLSRVPTYVPVACQAVDVNVGSIDAAVTIPVLVALRPTFRDLYQFMTSFIGIDAAPSSASAAKAAARSAEHSAAPTPDRSGHSFTQSHANAAGGGGGFRSARGVSPPAPLERPSGERRPSQQGSTFPPTPPAATVKTAAFGSVTAAMLGPLVEQKQTSVSLSVGRVTCRGVASLTPLEITYCQRPFDMACTVTSKKVASFAGSASYRALCDIALKVDVQRLAEGSPLWMPGSPNAKTNISFDSGRLRVGPDLAGIVEYFYDLAALAVFRPTSTSNVEIPDTPLVGGATPPLHTPDTILTCTLAPGMAIEIIETATAALFAEAAPVQGHKAVFTLTRFMDEAVDVTLDAALSVLSGHGDEVLAPIQDNTSGSSRSPVAPLNVHFTLASPTSPTARPTAGGVSFRKRLELRATRHYVLYDQPFWLRTLAFMTDDAAFKRIAQVTFRPHPVDAYRDEPGSDGGVAPLVVQLPPEETTGADVLSLAFSATVLRLGMLPARAAEKMGISGRTVACDCDTARVTNSYDFSTQRLINNIEIDGLRLVGRRTRKAQISVTASVPVPPPSNPTTETLGPKVDVAVRGVHVAAGSEAEGAAIVGAIWYNVTEGTDESGTASGPGTVGNAAEYTETQLTAKGMAAPEVELRKEIHVLLADAQGVIEAPDPRDTATLAIDRVEVWLTVTESGSKIKVQCGAMSFTLGSIAPTAPLSTPDFSDSRAISNSTPTPAGGGGSGVPGGAGVSAGSSTRQNGHSRKPSSHGGSPAVGSSGHRVALLESLDGRPDQPALVVTRNAKVGAPATISAMVGHIGFAVPQGHRGFSPLTNAMAVVGGVMERLKDALQTPDEPSVVTSPVKPPQDLASGAHGRSAQSHGFEGRKPSVMDDSSFQRQRQVKAPPALVNPASPSTSAKQKLAEKQRQDQIQKDLGSGVHVELMKLSLMLAGGRRGGGWTAVVDKVYVTSEAPPSRSVTAQITGVTVFACCQRKKPLPGHLPIVATSLADGPALDVATGADNVIRCRLCIGPAVRLDPELVGDAIVAVAEFADVWRSSRALTAPTTMNSRAASAAPAPTPTPALGVAGRATSVQQSDLSNVGRGGGGAAGKFGRSDTESSTFAPASTSATVGVAPARRHGEVTSMSAARLGVAGDLGLGSASQVPTPSVYGGATSGEQTRNPSTILEGNCGLGGGGGSYGGGGGAGGHTAASLMHVASGTSDATFIIHRGSTEDTMTFEESGVLPDSNESTGQRTESRPRSGAGVDPCTSGDPNARSGSKNENEKREIHFEIAALQLRLLSSSDPSAGAAVCSVGGLECVQDVTSALHGSVRKLHVGYFFTGDGREFNIISWNRRNLIAFYVAPTTDASGLPMTDVSLSFGGGDVDEDGSPTRDPKRRFHRGEHDDDDDAQNPLAVSTLSFDGGHAEVPSPLCEPQDDSAIHHPKPFGGEMRGRAGANSSNPRGPDSGSVNAKAGGAANDDEPFSRTSTSSPPPPLPIALQQAPFAELLLTAAAFTERIAQSRIPDFGDGRRAEASPETPTEPFSASVSLNAPLDVTLMLLTGKDVLAARVGPSCVDASRAAPSGGSVHSVISGSIGEIKCTAISPQREKVIFELGPSTEISVRHTAAIAQRAATASVETGVFLVALEPTIVTAIYDVFVPPIRAALGGSGDLDVMTVTQDVALDRGLTLSRLTKVLHVRSDASNHVTIDLRGHTVILHAPGPCIVVDSGVTVVFANGTFVVPDRVRSRDLAAHITPYALCGDASYIMCRASVSVATDETRREYSPQPNHPSLSASARGGAPPPSSAVVANGQPAANAASTQGTIDPSADPNSRGHSRQHSRQPSRHRRELSGQDVATRMEQMLKSSRRPGGHERVGSATSGGGTASDQSPLPSHLQYPGGLAGGASGPSSAGASAPLSLGHAPGSAAAGAGGIGGGGRSEMGTREPSLARSAILSPAPLPPLALTVTAKIARVVAAVAASDGRSELCAEAVVHVQATDTPDDKNFTVAVHRCRAVTHPTGVPDTILTHILRPCAFEIKGTTDPVSGSSAVVFKSSLIRIAVATGDVELCQRFTDEMMCLIQSETYLSQNDRLMASKARELVARRAAPPAAITVLYDLPKIQVVFLDGRVPLLRGEISQIGGRLKMAADSTARGTGSALIQASVHDSYARKWVPALDRVYLALEVDDAPGGVGVEMTVGGITGHCHELLVRNAGRALRVLQSTAAERVAPPLGTTAATQNSSAVLSPKSATHRSGKTHSAAGKCATGHLPSSLASSTRGVDLKQPPGHSHTSKSATAMTASSGAAAPVAASAGGQRAGDGHAQHHQATTGGRDDDAAAAAAAAAGQSFTAMTHCFVNACTAAFDIEAAGHHGTLATVEPGTSAHLAFPQGTAALIVRSRAGGGIMSLPVAEPFGSSSRSQSRRGSLSQSRSQPNNQTSIDGLGDSSSPSVSRTRSGDGGGIGVSESGLFQMSSQSSMQMDLLDDGMDGAHDGEDENFASASDDESDAASATGTADESDSNRGDIGRGGASSAAFSRQTTTGGGAFVSESSVTFRESGGRGGRASSRSTTPHAQGPQTNPGFGRPKARVARRLRPLGAELVSAGRRRLQDGVVEFTVRSAVSCLNSTPFPCTITVGGRSVTLQPGEENPLAVQAGQPVEPATIAARAHRGDGTPASMRSAPLPFAVTSMLKTRALSEADTEHPDCDVEAAVVRCEAQGQQTLALRIAAVARGAAVRLAVQCPLVIVNATGADIDLSLWAGAAGLKATRENSKSNPLSVLRKALPFVGKPKEPAPVAPPTDAPALQAAVPHERSVPVPWIDPFGTNDGGRCSLTATFEQISGETLSTDGAQILDLRKPCAIKMRDRGGRPFYLQVCHDHPDVLLGQPVATLHVSHWLVNHAEFPLLLCDDGVVTRDPLPGQLADTGVPPGRGRPFLVGVKDITDSLSVCARLGLDTTWSNKIELRPGAKGTMTSVVADSGGLTRSVQCSVQLPIGAARRAAAAHRRASAFGTATGPVSDNVGAENAQGERRTGDTAFDAVTFPTPVVRFTPRRVLCNATTLPLRATLFSADSGPPVSVVLPPGASHFSCDYGTGKVTLQLQLVPRPPPTSSATLGAASRLGITADNSSAAAAEMGANDASADVPRGLASRPCPIDAPACRVLNLWLGTGDAAAANATISADGMAQAVGSNLSNSSLDTFVDHGTPNQINISPGTRPHDTSSNPSALSNPSSTQNQNPLAAALSGVTTPHGQNRPAHSPGQRSHHAPAPTLGATVRVTTDIADGGVMAITVDEQPQAPLLIENRTSVSITSRQRSAVGGVCLQPKKSALHYWDDPDAPLVLHVQCLGAAGTHTASIDFTRPVADAELFAVQAAVAGGGAAGASGLSTTKLPVLLRVRQRVPPSGGARLTVVTFTHDIEFEKSVRKPLALGFGLKVQAATLIAYGVDAQPLVSVAVTARVAVRVQGAALDVRLDCDAFACLDVRPRANATVLRPPLIAIASRAALNSKFKSNLPTATTSNANGGGDNNMGNTNGASPSAGPTAVDESAALTLRWVQRLTDAGQRHISDATCIMGPVTVCAEDTLLAELAVLALQAGPATRVPRSQEPAAAYHQRLEQRYCCALPAGSASDGGATLHLEAMSIAETTVELTLFRVGRPDPLKALIGWYAVFIPGFRGAVLEFPRLEHGPAITTVAGLGEVAQEHYVKHGKKQWLKLTVGGLAGVLDFFH